MMSDIRSQTIKDFGEQWSHFTDNPGYYGSAALLYDICGPLIGEEEIRGKITAEIGSGTGRIVNMLLDAGAAHVYAVEPSAAFTVLQANTAERQEKITYIQDVGEAIPSDLNLDFICSIGVLHHIPDPDPVVKASYHALAPGGHMLVWLYGCEGNELYLKIVKPIRKLTTHLPHAVLSAFCSVLNVGVDLYLFGCRHLPLPMRDYMNGHLGKLSRDIRKLTIYDQLNPAYAKYYSRAEAEALLARAGFVDITSFRRHGYSWTVRGRKA